MSRFGGETYFGGKGYFGGVKIPPTPGYVISRMIAALEPIIRDGDNPRGIKNALRFWGSPRDEDDWKRMVALAGGLPAVLIHYSGGRYVPVGTGGGKVTLTANFSVFTVAGDYRPVERFDGTLSTDWAGDNLSRLVTHYLLRALDVDISCTKSPRPEQERIHRISPEAYALEVQLVADITADLYDDAIALELLRLGICHTPTDLSNLFETDNSTPNSTELGTKTIEQPWTLED